MFYRFRSFLLFVVSFSLLPLAHSQFDTGRPDSHAPIGVMSDHTHLKNEIMFSYRYMNMFMGSNRSGTSDVSDAQVLQQYMVTPTKMKMEMHMLGFMYAPSDVVTLMTMAPFIRKSMDHVNRMGRTFNTETQGIGDIKTSALILVSDLDRSRIHLNAGVSIPTGSIDKRDDTLMPNVQLPYPMQLGSGTVDLLPGITYLGQSDDWSWGGQAIYTLRLGDNSRDYRLGNKTELNAWLARNWANWISQSLGVKALTWGDISGRDKDLNPNMVATADPKRRAGDQVDLIFGLNFLVPGGFLRGHRLAFEWAFPIYQRLDGPQLATDYTGTIGWQKAF